MEIKLPLPPSQMALTRIKDSPLELKIGQILDVKILQIKQDTNTLTLELANKTLRLQSDQPLALAGGDKLKLEVVRLNPSPQFKVVNPAPNPNQPLSSPKPSQTDSILLRVPAPAAENPAVSSKNLPSPLPQTPLVVMKEPLTAKVVAVSEQQVQVQLLADENDSRPKPLIPITVDRTAAAALKPGQMVVLEPSRAGSGTVPEFKIAKIPAKITELIKQYLPIHESPVQFVDQLVKYTPDMQRNELVPAALKRLAQEIMQNLPRQQQLTQSAFIKQAISDSGLFLEAKLAFLQEEPTRSLPANDFKAQLLKWVEVLKHETNPHPGSKSTPIELDQLKILQQKAESGVAKIILDQLASLPKEDATQQLWHLEIPYLDKGKAESVKIEIEQEKQKNASQDNPSWSVTITITPPNLGTMHCKVSYLDGAINTHFWSQQAPVTRLIKQNLDTLRRQLEDSGLKTGHMGALDGTPVQSRLQGHPEKKLLDEKV